MSIMRGLARIALAIGLVVALAGTAGCALSGGTLGGREKCWPESEQRAPSIWRGILRIGTAGGRLETPEGDLIPLRSGALEIRLGDGGGGELVRGSDVVARAGDDLTLFGGSGADGVLVVCGVEEIHASG